MKHLQKGFTLIELMIVVAIIGILAAVAIPAYQDYIARAQMSEAVSLLSAGKVGSTEYISANGTCPVAVGDVVGTTRGKYTDTITMACTAVAAAGTVAAVVSLTFTAAMKATGVNSAIASKTAELRTTDSGTNWVCTRGTVGTAVDNKYLPSSCRI